MSKKIKITLIATVKEIESNIHDLRNEIQSGKFQREFNEGDDNVISVKATFEVIK